jgi:uncharacterized phage protein gp47/JayE
MSFEGLTDAGLDPPRAKDFFDEMRESINARFDEEIDLTENSVLGPLVLEMALQLGELSELLLEVYNARSLNNARGRQLDELVRLVGVTREGGAPSTIADVELKGQVGAEIPAGTKVKGGGPDGDLEWKTVDDRTLGVEIALLLPGAGDYTVEIRAPASAPSKDVTYSASSSDSTEDIADGLADAFRKDDEIRQLVDVERTPKLPNVGPNFVITSKDGRPFDVLSTSAPGFGDITRPLEGRHFVDVQAVEDGPYKADREVLELADSVRGLSGVENDRKANPGRFIQSDDQLRLQHSAQTQLPGSAAAEAIRSAVFEIEGVESAVVLENDLDSQITVAGLTLPESSIGVVVWPDDLDDDQHDRIARQVYRETPAGTEVAKDTGFTTIDRTVEKRDGRKKTVTVHYASTVAVTVDVDLTLRPGYEETDVNPPIDDKITSYINDLLVGDDVRRLRLYALIDEVEGVDSVQNLEVNPSRSSPETDLSISDTELAQPSDVIVST